MMITSSFTDTYNYTYSCC